MAKLADALAIHPSTINNYESGATELGTETYHALKHLGWDWVYVLDGRPTQVLSSEHIDWLALMDIIVEVDRLIAINQHPVTHEMRREMIRSAYSRLITDRADRGPAVTHVEQRSQATG